MPNPASAAATAIAITPRLAKFARIMSTPSPAKTIAAIIAMPTLHASRATADQSNPTRTIDPKSPAWM